MVSLTPRALCAALLAVGLAAAAISATLQAERIRTNAGGQPVLNADGSPRNYGPTELRLPANGPGRTATGASAARAPGTLASWGFADFGANAGYYGMVTARVGDHTELFASGVSPTTGSTYWYALRWNAAASRLDQTYVSDTQFLNAIQTLLMVRVAGGAQQLVVSTVDGNLRRYDPQTKALIGVGPGPCTASGQQFALAAADLDGNGTDELIGACNGGLLVVEGAGYAGWSLAGVHGSELAVGQLDDDPAQEIVLTGGFVVDSAQRKVQWQAPGGFGRHLALTDVNGDGRQDLVVAETWQWVRAYDVAQRSLMWSISTAQDVAAVHAADLNGDGVAELLVADGQWGSIHVYRTADQQKLGMISNPLHGVMRLLVWDVDGDGRPEVLWGAGVAGAGSSCLLVADWPTGSIRWRNIDMAGPFLGPVVGDLDGDGVAEVVIASTEADGGFASGRLVVFDSRTMNIRAIWQGVAGGNQSWTGVHALELRDIDGDGRLEILVGSDRFRSGLVEAFRFSGNGRFDRIWSNATQPREGPVVSVAMADIDGDGKPEVLTGTGSAGSNPEQGYLIYAYDAVSGVEKWRSNLNLGSPVTALLTGDFDGDGQLEIAAAVEWRGVYLYSALTHELKAIIPAPDISSLTRLDAYAIPRLLIGHYDGRATEHAFDGGKNYYEVRSLQLTSGPIDAITVGNNRSWWVASQGVLARYSGSTRLAESANYGQGFGRSVESIGFRGGVFSAGAYGLHRVDIAR